MSSEELIKNFREANEMKNKRLAAAELIELNYFSEELIILYIGYVTHPDEGLRYISVRGLLEAPAKYDEMIASSLSWLITHDDIEIRNFSVEIFTKTSQRGAFALIDYLDHPKSDVRKFAVDLLGMIAGENLLYSLMRLIEDIDLNVRLSCIEAIGNIAARHAKSDFDYSDISDLLKEHYDDEQLKTQIIETLGKIDRSYTCNFLINRLNVENDFFDKVIIIDAIGLNTSYPEIAHQLVEYIHTAPFNIKPVILKTVFNICRRTGTDFVLPDELRHIAYAAMMDNDVELNSVGLLSLGKSYYEDDIPLLLKAVRIVDYDEQEHILKNLMFFTSENVFEKFLYEYIHDIDDQSYCSQLEFISLFKHFKDDIAPQRAELIIRTILINSLLGGIGNQIEFLETCMELSHSTTAAILDDMLKNTNSDSQKIIADLLEATNNNDLIKLN